jgi:uncharacterized cupin superfamily protein
LVDAEALETELLCLEPGQKTKTLAGEWVYYVITGTASLTAGKRTEQLAMGGVAHVGADESHTLANPAENRLICLAVGTST